MKKGFLVLLACFLVLSQGVLFSALFSYSVDETYTQELRKFPSNSQKFWVRGVSEGRNDDVLGYLSRASAEYGVFISRTDSVIVTEGTDTHGAGFVVGILGDVDALGEQSTYTFLGQKVFDAQLLEELMTNEDRSKTIGVDISSLDSLAEIPQFRFGTSVVIRNLDNLVERTGTVNGEYRIVGLDVDEEEAFFAGLSEASGASAESFHKQLSGSYSIPSLYRVILLGLFIANSILLLAVLAITVVQLLPIMGRLLLLGWSRAQCVWQALKPIAATAFVSIILFPVFGYVWANGTVNSLTYYSTMVGAGILSFGITLLLMGIASIIAFSLTPIAAIRNRIPKKLLLAGTFVLYSLSSVAVVGVSIGIDEPMDEVSTNVQIIQAWDSVSDEYILSNNSIGEDSASFSMQSKKYHQDFYNWYSSIADKEGVTVINTAWYSRWQFQEMYAAGAYEHVPSEDHWYFAASPSYLERVGVQVDADVLEQARAGVRVYLLPDTLGDDERANVEAWLREDATSSFEDDDIPTIFNEKQEFLFVTYTNDTPLFTWSVDMSQDMYTRAPLIYLATPENMRFFESESLIGQDLGSSYIKLTREAAEKYTTPGYLRQFDLDDNNLVFLSVREHVDGLQKTLWTTIEWFGGVLLGVTLLMLASLFMGLSLFRYAYSERISVRRFMGESLMSVYRPLFIAIAVVLCLQYVAVFVAHTLIGIAWVSLFAAVQFLLAYALMRRWDMPDILRFLKVHE